MGVLPPPPAFECVFLIVHLWKKLIPSSSRGFHSLDFVILSSDYFLLKQTFLNLLIFFS